MIVCGVDLGTRWLALAMVEFPWLKVLWSVTLTPKFPGKSNNPWARLRLLAHMVERMAPAITDAEALAVELPRHLIGNGQNLMGALGPVLQHLPLPGRPTVLTNPNKGLPPAYERLFDQLGYQVAEEHQVDAVKAAALGYAAAVLGDEAMGEVFYL